MKRSSVSMRRPAKVRALVLGILCLLLVLVCFLAPILEPNDPNASNPAAIRSAPCAEYLFGTDNLGRCVFSRLLDGAGATVFSSLLITAASLLLGTLVGTAAGWYGGAVETLLMRLTDVFMALPQMVFAIAVAGILGGSLVNAGLALFITGWTLFARLAANYVSSLKKSEFISCARLSGYSDFYILLRHVIPNMAGGLLVNASVQLGTVMTGLAGLSFLGLGVTAPQAEWGSMLNDARAYIQLAPWAVFAPAAAIFLAVMLFNAFGDAMRDLTDGNGAV